MSSVSQIEQISLVLKNVQLKNGQLQEEKRALEERLTELEATLRALTKPKARRGRTGPPPPPPSPGLSDNESEPKDEDSPEGDYRGPDPYQLGKGFATLHQLFGTGLFVAPIVRPDLPPNDPKFFEKKDEKLCLLAALADLFDHVPEHFHSVLHSPAKFQTEFMRGFREIRYTSVNRLRSNAGLIFGLEQSLFQKGAPKTDDRVVRFLKFDLNSDKYPLFSPLAFPDCVEDYTVIFRSDIILSILRCVLNGPSALSPDRTGGTPPTNHAIWWLKEVTPGLIAFGYTFGIFLCATDREFTAIGKISGINYHDCYWRAKKWIVKAADLPSMVATLHWFRRGLFGGANIIRPVINIDTLGDNDDDILEAQLRRLRDASATASALSAKVNSSEAERAFEIEDITEIIESNFKEKTNEAAGEMTDGDEDLGAIIYSSKSSSAPITTSSPHAPSVVAADSHKAGKDKAPTVTKDVPKKDPSKKGLKKRAPRVVDIEPDDTDSLEVVPTMPAVRTTRTRTVVKRA